MKKLLILMLLLFVSFAWAGSLEVVTGCNVRDSADIKTSVVIGSVAKGGTFEIVGIYGDYHFVEILEGKDNVGKKGWLWDGVIRKDGATGTVIGEGGTIRKEPSKKSAVVCYVFKDSELKITGTKITWYKIKGSEQVGFDYGWIYSKCAKEAK